MRTLITSLLILLSLSLSAQSVISGKVTNNKGVPIEGANVYLEGTYDGTTTDKEGKFSFTTAETGSQTLIVFLML